MLHRIRSGVVNKRRAAIIVATMLLPAALVPGSAQASTIGGGGGGCAVWVYNVHRISATAIGANAIYSCETSKVAINVDITATRPGLTVPMVHQCGTGFSCTVAVVIKDVAGSQAYNFLAHGQFYLNQQSLYAHSSTYHF